MYVRWQSRKRQQPAFGYWHDVVRDKTGDVVRNERWTPLTARKRADGSIGQDVSWKAVLVENVRVDGKPRQRHVAHLASIPESAIEIVHQRRHFWDAVHERLDRLGNRMSIEDRRQIEAAIASKVPRLSREEHDASVESGRGYGLEGKPYRPPT